MIIFSQIFVSLYVAVLVMFTSISLIALLIPGVYFTKQYYILLSILLIMMIPTLYFLNILYPLF